MKIYLLYAALVLACFAAGVLIRRLVTNRQMAWLLYGLLGALIVAFMWHYSQPEQFLSDFKKAYYPAGEIIRTEPSDLYSDEPLLFVNIPILAWIFVPFSYLDIDLAGIIMTALGLVAVLASFTALVRMGRLSEQNALLVAAAFVISGPLYYSIREGNTTHFILLALIGMAWCVTRGWYGWAGVLLAAAVLIKPPLALVVLPFVVRGRWSFVASFVAVGAVTLGLSLAFYGVDLHRDWYDYAVRPYSQHPIGAESVQSLDAVLARLVTDDHLDDFNPIESLGTRFTIVRTAIAAALFLAVAAVVWRARRDDSPRGERLDACLVLCLALLIAPTSWTHYYLLLLLPVALIVAGDLRRPWTTARIATVVLAVALISPPVVYVRPDAPLLSWLVPHILISHYFFGGLLLAAVIAEARWHSADDRSVEAAGHRIASAPSAGNVR